MYYFGKVFTATAGGRRMVPVTCEKCATNYFYVLTRSGTGQGHSHYGFFQDSARESAAKTAQEQVAKKLEREVEVVPCPKCHWVNDETVCQFRKTMYPGLLGYILAAIVFGLLLTIVSVVPFAALGVQKSIVAAIIPMACLSLAVLSPIWVPILRWQLRRRFDPNATHPDPPTLPIGTPPALVEQMDSETNQRILAPASSPPPSHIHGATPWAVFHIGDFLLPKLCCVCMEPATAAYRSNFKASEGDNEVEGPLCGPCYRHRTWLWWKLVFALAIGAFCVAAMVMFGLIPERDPNRYVVFWIVGIVGTIILAATIPGWLCQPFKFGYVHRDRGIVKFAAHNPMYTRLLIELHHQSQRFVIDDSPKAQT